MRESTRFRLILIFGAAGLIVASLTGLSEHVGWLNAICGSLSGACRETAKINLANLPIWVWGIGYFLVLILLAAVRATRPAVLWVVAAGLGMEATLVGIMISMKWFCVFCMANLVVMILLAVAALETSRIWQAISACLVTLIITGVWLPRENGLFAMNEARAGEQGISARVGDTVITDLQVAGSNGQRILELERDAYKLKKQRLDELLAEVLLKKEAAARNITVQQLLNDEINSKIPPATELDVDKYIQINAEQLRSWTGTQEELRSRIKASLQQDKAYVDALKYANTVLAPKYGAKIYLQEPQPLITRVKIDGSPTLGSPAAPITVVEFSDFECPSCRAAHEAVKKVREAYAGRIRWVFKDYPLSFHKHAEKAAEAAWCAKEQDKYWQFQDVLYTAKDLEVDKIKELAREHGLSTGQFNSCLDSGKYKKEIEEQMKDAKDAGIDRTPSFIINGRLLTGVTPFEQFKQIIDEEMVKSTLAQQKVK